MAAQFEFYRTPRPKERGESEQYHARLVNFQHIDTDYLAEEIHSATSLTVPDVKAVLESLSHFMGNRLKEGQRIHLEGLGYFQITLKCTETITSPKAYANKVAFKAIGFKADKKLKSELGGMRIERSKFRPHSAKRSETTIDKMLTTYFSTNRILTRSDFQKLCGFTRITACRQIKLLVNEKKLKNINSKNQPIYVPMPGYYGEPE